MTFATTFHVKLQKSPWKKRHLSITNDMLRNIHERTHPCMFMLSASKISWLLNGVVYTSQDPWNLLLWLLFYDMTYPLHLMKYVRYCMPFEKIRSMQHKDILSDKNSAKKEWRKVKIEMCIDSGKDGPLFPANSCTSLSTTSSNRSEW